MKIKLGEKEYSFSLKNKALCSYEEATGKNPYEVILKLDKISPLEMSRFVYHGCLTENKDFPLTQEEVIDLVGFKHLEIVAKEATIAILGNEAYEKAASEEGVKKNLVSPQKK